MTAAAPPDPLAAVRELLARDAWPREQLLAFQQERVRALVADAVARSPYYRETLGPDAVDAPLAELPILTKTTLTERFDDLVTDRDLRLAELREFVGGHSAALYRDRYLVFTTSGSTGVPGIFVYDRDEFAHWTVNGLACFARYGVTPETRLVSIGAPAGPHFTRRLFDAFLAGREGVPTLTVTMPLAQLVEELNRCRPEVLATYASVLGSLAEEQLEGRLAISPRLTVVGAEPLTDETVSAVERAWGSPPMDVYGATEAPTIAYGPRGAMRVCEDMLVLEVVDEDDRPAQPGTPGAKVLVTNLVNRALPLIRCELTDKLVLADAPELRVASIDGRREDALDLPAAAGGTVRVPSIRVAGALSVYVELLCYQVTRERDLGLRVSVVPRGTPAGDLADRIRDTLVHSLEDAGAAVPRVRVEYVSELIREPGPGAKVKRLRVET